MNKQEFGNLVMESERLLYRVAKSILHDDDDCADAIGEAVTNAFEKLHTLKNDEYARTWLVRILINECYSLKRYAQRFAYSDDGEELEVADEQATAHEDYSELYESIGKLSSKNRLVIVLYYLEGYSVREISQILRIRESAVRKRMARARNELKELLREDGYLWTSSI